MGKLESTDTEPTAYLARREDFAGVRVAGELEVDGFCKGGRTEAEAKSIERLIRQNK